MVGPRPDTHRGFESGLICTTVVPSVWDLPSSAAAAAAGASHLFLSGGALSASLGYPDKGLIDISELVQVVHRIKAAVSLPLMADIEAGYGSLYRLARLVDDLVGAGLDAIMIEDQEETGQSVAQKPRLCSPELMVERIRIARETGGARLKILARSDCIRDVPFEENVERLRKYKEAGADWVLPVFVSREDLKTASATFGTALWVIATPSIGADGYIPTLADAREIGVIAALVTSQNRNAFRDMMTSFEMTLEGSWERLRAEMISTTELDRHLKRDRFEGSRSKW